MHAHSASVTGHDPPAFREAKTQSTPGIATRKERVEGVCALSRSQLGPRVVEIEFQPLATLPVAMPRSNADSSIVVRSLADCSNCVPQQLDADHLKLLGVDGGKES